MRNIVWSLSIRKTSSQNIDVQDRTASSEPLITLAFEFEHLKCSIYIRWSNINYNSNGIRF